MRISQQWASSLFFVLFGATVLYLAHDMPMGTAADMGIGYVPRALAWGCVGVGLVLGVGAVRTGAASEPVVFALRAVCLVISMVVMFAVLLPYAGLPMTVVLSVLPAAFSGERFRWPILLAVALGLAALTTGLFAWALGLLIPVFPVGLHP